MAGIKDINFVYGIMRDKSLPYWKMTLGSEMICNYDEGNMEDSIQTMAECLKAIDNQTVKIVIRPKSGKQMEGGDVKTNVFTYYFETKNLQPNNQNNFTPVINGLDDATVDRMIEQAKEIERLKHQIELNKLQNQINDIRKEREQQYDEEPEGIGSVMMGIFEEVKPYIPHLASKFLGVELPNKKPMALGNIDDTEEKVEQKISTEKMQMKPEQVEQAKKAGQAGMRLAAIDEYFGDRLLLLAELAEKDFQTYQMGCTFVEGAVNKLK